MSDFDAIVLAGGTARRLGGTPKHALEVDGRTLLARTLDAVADARQIIVVGDEAELRQHAGTAVIVREDPPLAGPAAGIGAALPRITAERVVVLACDHPFVADAVTRLLAAEQDAIAVDADGRRQNLLFVASTAALRRAVDKHATLTNLAVHALLGPIAFAEIDVPAHALRDIDTWQDLERD